MSEANQMQSYIGKRTDMLEAVQALTDFVGRQPKLPEWVDDGAILGIQGGEQKVHDILLQAPGNLPIVAVWLQGQYIYIRICLGIS